MKRLVAHLPGRLACLPFVAALLILPAGCAVTADGGYGYSGTAVMGVDYYEPFGDAYDFGAWGSDYRVGPSRGGIPRFGAGGGARGYRPAAASRAMPSIPMGGRGGGGRSFGGGRAGGGRR